jgi:hypothetical protein
MVAEIKKLATSAAGKAAQYQVVHGDPLLRWLILIDG